jgi:ABC-type nitrate/sulfonate/bicarbonate transport system substrate-binding protein
MTSVRAFPLPTEGPARPRQRRHRRRHRPVVRRHRHARRAAAGAVTSLVLALTACGGTTANRSTGGQATGSAKGPQKLRIALDYTANVDYLGIYVAINDGYFKAEGIDPEIIPYSGPGAEQLLEEGKTDLGLTYPPNIPAYRAAKPPLDYEAVAGLSQRNTIDIAVLASSKYTNVAQLSGTLYGGFGVPSDKPIIDDVFTAAGVKDPVYKEVDLGDEAYRALADHRVAYSITYGGIDDVTAELSGVKLREWPIKRYLGSAFSFPDDAWVATDKEVHDDAGLLRRGLAALAKGYEYAAHHPATAEAILIKDNRSALDHSANIVKATGDATAATFVTASGAWGPMNDADFAGITKILVAGGLIKTSRAPAPAQDYTNGLLP